MESHSSCDEPSLLLSSGGHRLWSGHSRRRECVLEQLGGCKVTRKRYDMACQTKKKKKLKKGVGVWKVTRTLVAWCGHLCCEIEIGGLWLRAVRAETLSSENLQPCNTTPHTTKKWTRGQPPTKRYGTTRRSLIPGTTPWRSTRCVTPACHAQRVSKPP